MSSFLDLWRIFGEIDVNSPDVICVLKFVRFFEAPDTAVALLSAFYTIQLSYFPTLLIITLVVTLKFHLLL
jgi:hypothetical protein